MDKVARDTGGLVDFYRVDTDRSADLARRFAVRAIPLLVRFEGGREAGQLLGYHDEAAVRSFAGTG